MNKAVLDRLIKETNKAYKQNEIPVGCVIVKDNKIISYAHNTKNSTHKCINHAEILAIIKAEKKLKDWRLNECEMYVTLEPCNMCKEVIRQSRLACVNYLISSTFSNEDKKTITYNKIEINDDYNNLFLEKLKSFFVNKR